MASSRVLRVAVLIGDRLVEERLVDARVPVTFGQSLRCAISVPVEGVPYEHVLFEREHGSERFVLRVTATMDGKLAQRATVLTFPELRRGVTPENGAWIVPLARGARGRLALGDATVLFQEVARPAEAPRVQLPASLRGTLAERVDRRLAVILGASLVAHIGIAAWAWSGDVEAAALGVPSIATVHQDTMEITLPELAPPPTALPGTMAIPHAAPTLRPARVMVPAPIAAPRASDARQLANVLVGNEVRRQPGADLDHQLDELRANHSRVTIGDDSHTSRVDDRASVVQGGRELPLDQPEIATRTRKAEEPIDPRARAHLGRVRADDQTTLTAEMLVDKIQSVYLAGMQRCYARGLALDATLAGRVDLTLTVDEAGHVVEPDAAGGDAQVDRCIASQMTAWRFAIPRDKTGTPTDATFHVTLALQSS